jgi:hypothetical protein
MALSFSSRAGSSVWPYIACISTTTGRLRPAGYYLDVRHPVSDLDVRNPSSLGSSRINKFDEMIRTIIANANIPYMSPCVESRLTSSMGNGSTSPVEYLDSTHNIRVQINTSNDHVTVTIFLSN